MAVRARNNVGTYRALAKRIRQHVLRMVHRARSSHVGSSLSIADLLAVLYRDVLRVDPQRPDWPERDRFILSKGHACAAVYAALAERGFFPVDWLNTYYQDGSHLAGHITHRGVPGVEVSTGSLGHGLSIAAGMALAGKHENQPYRVFALLSDGECDEGSTWEAIMFAAQHKFDNLAVIVDYNRVQALGHVEDVIELEPFLQKIEAFGWTVREIDGHNYEQIESTLSNLPLEKGKPSFIIARTTKGKGVSWMENTVSCHYGAVNDEELAKALAELGVEQ